VLNILLLTIDILSGLFLVITILLHAGRGGGLSDMFGGPGGGTSLQGSTVVEKNLDRITVLMSLIFFFSTIALGLRLD
jgi:preprotein translocase subunit SecG